MAELGFDPKQLGLMLRLSTEASLAQGGRAHGLWVGTVGLGPPRESCGGHVSKTCLCSWVLDSNPVLVLTDPLNPLSLNLLTCEREMNDTSLKGV